MNKDKQETIQQVEIKYLRELVDEVKDKNKILSLNNDLLLQRINRLEEENADLKKCKQTHWSGVAMRPTVSVNQSNERSQPTTMPAENLEFQKRSHPMGPVTGANLSTNNGGNQKKFNWENKPKLIKRMSHHKEDVSNDVSSGEENSGDTFTKVTRRKRRKNLGTGNSFNDKNDEFAGGERKVWLYINRIKRSATDQVIKKYIEKNGFQGEQVEVKELPTDENRLKAFVVTAPLKRKDELYDPAFWPSGVGIRRFDFNRHRDFLKNGGDFA